MGNHPSSHHPNITGSAATATTNGGGVGVAVRSATLNRRSSNTGATTTTTTSLSPTATTTTTTTTSASSSPSVSHHNTGNTRNSTSTSSSSGNMNTTGGMVGINIRNMFQQLHMKHGQNNSNNALGITRAEFDERCKPSGYVVGTNINFYSLHDLRIDMLTTFLFP